MKDHIFELRRKILRHDWSSQWHTQQINKFKKMNEWMPEKKKIQAWTGFEPSPWPLRYRCSVLATKLSSHLEPGLHCDFVI